jgi:hypothetical protein
LDQQLDAKFLSEDALFNFQLEIGYPLGSFSWFFSVPPAECQNSFWKCHDRFLGNLRYDPTLITITLLRDFRFPGRWCRSGSSGLWRHIVTWEDANLSEDLAASILRVCKVEAARPSDHDLNHSTVAHLTQHNSQN